jgi:hypothetical protein
MRHRRTHATCSIWHACTTWRREGEDGGAGGNSRRGKRLLARAACVSAHCVNKLRGSYHDLPGMTSARRRLRTRLCTLLPEHVARSKPEHRGARSHCSVEEPRTAPWGSPVRSHLIMWMLNQTVTFWISYEPRACPSPGHPLTTAYPPAGAAGGTPGIQYAKESGRTFPGDVGAQFPDCTLMLVVYVSCVEFWPRPVLCATVPGVD